MELQLYVNWKSPLEYATVFCIFPIIWDLSNSQISLTFGNPYTKPFSAVSV